jgi:hypothetical protein
VLLALAVALPLLAGARADAQVNPLWDHYKVYLTPPFPVPPLNIQIQLTDQFGQYPHTVFQMDRFMNPTQKEDVNGIFPINNPVLHYAWWQISPQPFSASVIATNQFGDQPLNVHDAVYLLTPALKNQSGPPPANVNHYKCYLCDGQPVNKSVLMTDQFGQWSANVTFPRYLCNPAQKDVGAAHFPIVDPAQHYVCYEFQPEDPSPHTATFSDQFIQNGPLNLQPARYICVPSLKQVVTDVNQGTWGRLKEIYR